MGQAGELISNMSGCAESRESHLTWSSDLSLQVELSCFTVTCQIATQAQLYNWKNVTETQSYVTKLM